MPASVTNWTQPAVRRYIKILQCAPVSSSFAATTIGRVYLNEFEVTETCRVDRIAWYNFATVAGNITVGIYGPLVTEDTPEGAPLLVSAEVAQAGASAAQAATITTTTLVPGRYYAAIEFSDATATVGRTSSTEIFTTMTMDYDRGGYGALIDPCPAPSDTSSSIQMVLRVVV
jgi:hypothetical protein